MVTETATTEYRITQEAQLRSFIATVLERVGVAGEDAALTARILTEADLAGIESHGVARLESYYISRIRQGLLAPSPHVVTEREGATSLVIDAGNGLGHPTSYRTMERVIAKAKAQGNAFATVRNSNHFGIAGFYARMALEHDLIGICLTNSVRYAAPTYGREIVLGTNPIAIAIPTEHESPFVLDFATTTVPRGKLEVYQRKAKPLQPGWAIDAEGHPTTDPVAALKGALLPLGGFGVENGGHKGFGLALLVDILCGVLSGGLFGLDLPSPQTPPQAGAISHFFGAISVANFREVGEFKSDMDRMLRQIKEGAKVPGADRIYVAGEIESEATQEHRTHGIPIHIKVWDGLERLAKEYAVPFTL